MVPGYSRLGYRLRGLSWTSAIAGSLRGQTALVTGGTSGIGEAAAEGLLLAGATVHLLGRDPGRTRDAVRRLGVRVPRAESRLHQETCDLSELADVRRFSESFLARHARLDVLVNNAGVLSPSRRQTADGIELTFATNVLGPFLLTSLLLPALAAGGTPRVITVSSGGMYTARLRAGDLDFAARTTGSRAYAHTKRIEVILNRLWAEHHGSDGFLFHSMHPGWVATPGLRRSLPQFERLMRPALRSPRQGADTIVWLATAPLPRSSGGAFWHDRMRRPQYRLPGTRETESERRLLWDSCERLSTISNGAPCSAAAVRNPKKKEGPMAQYSATLATENRPDDVWRYLADLRSIVEWDPSVEDARLVAGEPGLVATRYELDVRFLGRTVTLPYETVVAEPPHRLVFAAETDAMSIADKAMILPTVSGSSPDLEGVARACGAGGACSTRRSGWRSRVWAETPRSACAARLGVPMSEAEPAAVSK